MGEVLKFKRPRRRTRTRPTPPTHSGTVILFTGIWYGREAKPDPAPKRTRRKPAKRLAKGQTRSPANPRDTIFC